MSMLEFTERCLEQVFESFCSFGNIDSMEGSWTESNKLHTQHGYDSSSNSNSSSISSISGSSSDSDYKMMNSELEADADSLTCRQSGLSSNEQLGSDVHKSVLNFVYISSSNCAVSCMRYGVKLFSMLLILLGI